ncbi:MAG: arylsulfatase [Desulfobacteraceae bacterium]|nr:arylsulfatase [Desulfobacteraceae bacterium]
MKMKSVTTIKERIIKMKLPNGLKKAMACTLGLAVPAGSVLAQDVLPFAPTPSGSIAGRTMAESVYNPLPKKSHLPADAPNILIILIDDAGPGTPDTYGGEYHTPNLSKIANQGISYGAFHSTAMSSPTRSALLTGRNHTRVGNGQISEISNDFDGFTGLIPKTSATTAEVLKNYGYSTAAFGKWHMTPATECSKAGPFENWPTGYGFEYFYGFLGGETSQYEPFLVKNTTYVHPPRTPEEGYHLTEDLADNAIEWLHNHRAIHPDKPFYMYWATGAIHGPHHVPKEWADKYKGKFDDGWDAYRERVYKKMLAAGTIPPNTKLTPRPENLASWESIPENEKPFQRRLMEVLAGFAEHADHHAGRLIDELDKMGIADNTLIFYIWGDNGSSSEGVQGTISELLTQNQIPTKIEEHLKALDELGGLDVLGSPFTDNMFHAGWAWAGSTPYKGTKLLAAYFGGTRQPLAVAWPKKIKHDKTIRPQFHHVIDISPTIYEILDITPPRTVNSYPQDPIDGVSMVYSFSDATAPTTKKTQFFDIMGSRGIYSDGWFACTFGPRVPWLTVTPGMAEWTPDKDVWELYNLEEDHSQANDLAKQNPDKLDALKQLFLIESANNNNLPLGGGLWCLLHPEDSLGNPATEFNLGGDVTRIPEFSAPKIGRKHNKITINADIPKDGEGVLFAIGGFAGGLTCYLKDGYLNYEYNQFEVRRTKLKSSEKLSAGKSVIEIVLVPKGDGTLKSGDVTIQVNGKEVAKGTVPILANLLFSTEGLDVGTDLGSPVSMDYYHEAPFAFNGTIENMNVKYLE